MRGVPKKAPISIFLSRGIDVGLGEIRDDPYVTNGFDDVSYFVRFFKQKTGLTPREFKKQLLGK